jgi:hypothetical protein
MRLSVGINRPAEVTQDPLATTRDQGMAQQPVHPLPVTSLLQTGSDMISAAAGRGRPRSDFLSVNAVWMKRNGSP